MIRFDMATNKKRRCRVTVFLVACVCTLIAANSGCEVASEPPETCNPVTKLTPSDGFSHQSFGASVALSGNQALIVSFFAGDKKDSDYAKPVDVFDLTLRKKTGQLVPLSDIRLKRHWQISADDRWAAVAAYSEKPSEAYVFDLKTGKQKTVLKPRDDLFPNDLFGSSISLKGGRVIIGAYNVARGGDSDRPGTAYIFGVEDGKQIHKLVSKNAKHGDCFGCSVAISDSFAVVGASGCAVRGLEGAGAAYVFDIRTGKQVSVLTARYSARREVFGHAVAIFGDMVVIGAPNSYPDAKAPGSAYVFDARSGKMLTKLRPADSSDGDLFGGAVGISQRLIVVGATGGDSERGKDTGAAYAFDPVTGKELAKLTAGDLKPLTLLSGGSEIGSVFGLSLAVTADWIAIGAIGGDSKSTSDTGAVYMFRATDIYSKPPASQPSR